MAERSRGRGESGERSRSRPEGRSAAPKGPPRQRPGGMKAEELLEMADDLEGYAREILAQARKLQRMARAAGGSGDAGGEQRPTRPPAGRQGGGTGSRPRGSGERPERDSQDRKPRSEGSSGKARSGGRPDWAPEHRKRKS